MLTEHHISKPVYDTVNSCISGTMKIGVVIALTTAVMLMELIAYAAACQPNHWADGCSGVSDFDFTDDCNKHDICYACVSLKLNLFYLLIIHS